jgi:hypothetical protein
MESTSPEHPEPRLIDRTSLSDAQKKSFQETVDQAREEETARQQSMPTKLLAWLMIAGFGFEITSSFTSTGLSFGGIIFLFVGILIFKGSQSALRFANFTLVPLALFGLVDVAWSLIHGHPIEAGNQWATRDELRFWTLGVSPAVYFSAEALLAILALRLRRLRYWTTHVKVWTWIFGVVLGIQFVGSVIGFLQQREVRRVFSPELDAARNHVVRWGPRWTTTSLHMAPRTYESMPRIHGIYWRNSPGGRTTIYDPQSSKSLESKETHVHEEWLQTTAGEWGKLEVALHHEIPISLPDHGPRFPSP